MRDRTQIARLREQVWRANMDLVEKGLVISTFGNASGIDRELGLIAIKPSGVGYKELSPRNMVLLDTAGRILEGSLNPSSDTKTHLKLYAAFPEIGGVAHAHSMHATAWAQARRALPCLGTTHADYFRGKVPCTAPISARQISRDYEEETGIQIVKAFRDLDYREMPAVLVASHGPFTWGEDALEAVAHCEILERIAQMAAISFSLNPRVGSIYTSLLDKHFLRKHGKGAYYGQKG